MVIGVWCMTLRQCEKALAWRRQVVAAACGTEVEASTAAVWQPDIARLESRRDELLAWQEWRDELER